MSTDMASYTNSISSVDSSNEETKQVEAAGPPVAEQRESSDTVENESNLEAKLLQTEAEVSVPDNTQSKESTNGETQESVDKVEEDEWLDILGSGQLKKKVLKHAENGYRPQRSHICEINLQGCLQDGTVIDKHDHLSVQIGDVEVVQGLDIVLPLMDVGEVALLEVGPRFAYGSQGREPDVPHDATITYTVELLSSEPEPEIETLPPATRKEIGCRKRERGNWWYARQEHTLAIQCYRRALDYLDIGITVKTGGEKSSSLGAEQDLHELLEDHLKVYNNLAAAQMKIKAYDAALQSVENVLHCQPNNVKAVFRKGKILAAKGENSSAVSALRLAAQLEPNNAMIRRELLRMLTLYKEDIEHEKTLYKKMFGEDKCPESQPKDERIAIPWGILFGTLAVLVAGFMAYRYKWL